MCAAASTRRRTLAGYRRPRLVAVRAPRLNPHTSTGPPPATRSIRWAAAAAKESDHIARGAGVGESSDRDGAAGVGRVAVALELDADHPAALGEPGEHLAEAALEGDDAAVQGDQ